MNLATDEKVKDSIIEAGQPPRPLNPAAAARVITLEVFWKTRFEIS